MQKASVDYLRVSVTDRCNLRCVYCNPLDAQGLTDRAEMLGANEIEREIREDAGLVVLEEEAPAETALAGSV